MCKYLRPRSEEFAITGAGRKIHVQLRSFRWALAGFVRTTSSRLERAIVLVDVGEDQIGIIFERIEDAVAVMHVDIDVGHPLDRILGAQGLDYHAQIVEHAKSRGTVAARVMQSADRLEARAQLASHDLRKGIQRRSDYRRRRREDSREDRRIAVVQVVEPVAFGIAHALDVRSGVEAFDLRWARALRHL